MRLPRFAAIVLAIGLVDAGCLSVSAPARAVSRGARVSAQSRSTPTRIATQSAPVSALDLIELQIAYTTLFARYYGTVTPRTLVDGARTGIAAELMARGLPDVELPYTPARVDFGSGGPLVDAMVLRTLARYGKRLDGHALVAAAVAGELSSLRDPYSVLFHPQQFKKFNAFLGNGEFGGIGALLSFEAAAGRARVQRVLDGGAASAAGIRAGDALVAIDGRSVATLGPGGLRDALRGKIGTTVRVALSRDGATQTLTLVRAVVRDPAVTTRRFDDVGYLALSRFGDRAGRDVADALDDLRAQGATAFVLDLRGNGGGYGDEATAVAAAFMAGPVFVTKERDGATSVARAAQQKPFSGRLAILVDGDTASAAEIVAGALQDAHVATIVGARTFGKGLVQSVFPLPDGSAFKLTTARYATPAGRDIDRIGIVPDLAVAQPASAPRGDPASDVQLAAALAAVRKP